MSFGKYRVCVLGVLRVLRVLGVLSIPAVLNAQAAPATEPATSPSTAPATTATTATTATAVSGTIVGQYEYLLGGPREDFNQFSLNRAYLTVRGTPAQRLSFRLTSDVYQSGDENGWTLRMKYAYLDYAFNAGAPWATTLRAGVLQTVAIEQLEGFWPRWLGPVALDRHGFFQSADAGVAVHTDLPGELGEVYTHVVNGTGYARRESDRFKDFGVRASLTPFASQSQGLLASLAVTGWIYDGSVAGAAASDGSTRRLDRDRWGVHAGVKSHRLTIAADHSRRTDDIDSDPSAPPVILRAEQGTVTSGFGIVRPFAFAGTAASSPFGFFARYDHVDPSSRADGAYHYLLAGALYDVNSRMSVSLNYQEQLGESAPSLFRGAIATFALNF